VRLALATALALVLVLTAAACGSDKKESSTDTTSAATSAVDNTIYERAYTECSSTSLQGLAGKYQVANPTVDNVSQAVGAAWSDRFNGGEEGQKIGESGCRDGISSRPDSPGSA
jgi:ABC-type glycerol-3-phosphate transport system substrate-binding protein